MIDRARIREEVVRVIDGNAEGLAYHGPSTKSNLVDVTPELAAARPIAEGHSIWELLVHIKVDREWAIARLRGEKPEMDWWPPIRSQTSTDWKSLLSELDEVQARFLEVMQHASEEDVVPVVRFLMHHEIYHSGQIALLRKVLGLSSRPG